MSYIMYDIRNISVLVLVKVILFSSVWQVCREMSFRFHILFLCVPAVGTDFDSRWLVPTVVSGHTVACRLLQEWSIAHSWRCQTSLVSEFGLARVNVYLKTIYFTCFSFIFCLWACLLAVLNDEECGGVCRCNIKYVLIGNYTRTLFLRKTHL
jgi:hypothetical protein